MNTRHRFLVSVPVDELIAIQNLIRQLAEMVLQIKLLQPVDEATIEALLAAQFTARELLTKASAMRGGKVFVEAIG